MKKVLVMLALFALVSTNANAMKYFATLLIGAVGESGLGKYASWGSCKPGHGLCVEAIGIEHMDNKSSDYVDTDGETFTFALSKSIHKGELDETIKNQVFVFSERSFLSDKLISQLGLSSENQYFIEKGEYKVEDTKDYLFVNIKINKL